MKKKILLICMAVALFCALPTFAQNLVVNWDGIAVDGGAGTPNSYGWTSTSTLLVWQVANGAGNCRYRDFSVTGGQTSYKWETTAAAYTSRVLMLRWDLNNDVNSGVFSYPVTLEAGAKYTVTFDCASGNGSGGGVPVENAFFYVGLAPNQADTVGIGNVQKQVFTTGVSQEFGSETFSFKSSAAGTYYLKFWKGSTPAQWEWFGLGKLSFEKERTDFNAGDTLRINFQPNPGRKPGGSFVGALAPVGFLVDSGAVYSNKGEFSFGWDVSVLSQARQRTDPALGDDPKGNMIQFNRPGSNGVWKVKLAPGAYQVHLVGGDASYTDSKNSFLLNKQILADQTPALSNWDEYNVAVAVDADSILSFTSSDAANNAKVCYIEISKFTSSQSVITNGDFEDGLTGWDNMGGKVNIETDPGLVLSGSQSLKLGQTASSMVYQKIYAGPGDYVYSALGKEISPDGAVSRVDIWDKTDNNKLFRLQFSEAVVKNLMTKVSFAAYDTFIIEAYTRSGGLDSAYFDDISLSKFNKPVISIVSPALYQTYNIGEVVSISATASFTNKVKFFVDNKLIAEDTEAPYTCDLATVKAGGFLISAAAFDVFGDSILTENVSIEVVTPNLISNGGFEDGLTGWVDKGGKNSILTDPALVIKGNKTLKLGPTAWSMLYDSVLVETGKTYLLSAWGFQQAADGSESRVQIWDKTDNVKYASLSFFNSPAPIQNFVKVEFPASDTVLIEVFTRGGGLDSVYFDDITLSEYTAPTVSLITPSQDQIFGMDAVISINADASNASKVKFFANGELIGETLAKPYTLQWNAPLDTFEISVAAFDATGDSILSNSVKIIKQTEKIAPTPISRFIATPGETSVSLKWSAATDASGIKGYIVFVNDAVADTVSTFAYTSVSLNSSTLYTFKVIALDIYDNASSPVSIQATTLQSTVGIKINSAVKADIYPNPVSSELFINSPEGIKYVSIVNLNGKTLVSKSVDGKESTMNVSNLENGLYILKVDLVDGHSNYFKVLKK